MANVGRETRQNHKIGRKHPRIDTDLPCTVGFSDGDFTTARIFNISLSGLNFSCGQDTIQQILPDDQRTPGQVIDVEVEIHFDLQSKDGTLNAVRAIAEVIHSERLAQHVFHVGLQFIDLEDAAALALAAYIDECRDSTSPVQSRFASAAVAT